MESEMMISLTRVVTEAVKGLYSPQMIADLTARGVYMSQVGFVVGIVLGSLAILIIGVGILGATTGHWDMANAVCYMIGVGLLLITVIVIPASISSEYQWRHYPDIQFIRQILE